MEADRKAENQATCSSLGLLSACTLGSGAWGPRSDCPEDVEMLISNSGGTAEVVDLPSATDGTDHRHERS